ncbi:MAG: hypothetical protein E6R09_05765 [Rhodocyclaceae bacterium]|jgi:hypothetical protein|nr:MAG: hypothetical protein E6R09_05765 [Rhodocyclaceae bacterium]
MSATVMLPAPSCQVSLLLTNWFLDFYYSGLMFRDKHSNEKLFANFAYLALSGSDVEVPPDAYYVMASCCTRNFSPIEHQLEHEAQVIKEWLMSASLIET